MAGTSGFEILFDHSMDALLVVDSRTLKILEANPAVGEVLGYRPDALVGRSFTVLFPDKTSETLKPTLDKIKNYGSVFVDQFRRADGSLVMVDITATLFPWKRKSAVLVTFRDVSERNRVEKDKERLISDLRQALRSIKTLRGLLPICSSCKRIRNDRGYWEQVEIYIRDHSEADFSHGLCPECARKLYPGLADDDSSTQKPRSNA
jgi:PAS domain S-box-containing protein